VIAFGSAITDPEAYRRYAEAGIRRAAEPDSEIFANAPAGSLFRSYNLILDLAAARDDLEALVLVHQDAEIVDRDFCATLRAALSDPKIGVVGCVGAIGVRSIAWWEGSVTWGSFMHHYQELGGGDLPAFSWNGSELPPYARTGEVDTVDGFVLGLAPWTVRNVRFDESLGALHGYDFDYCLQVREAGRKVMTADFRAIHHRKIEMLPDPEEWIEAHISVAEKWDGRMPRIGTAPGSWRERALRAEAERDAAGALAHTKVLELDARARELERGLAETRESLSWRLSAPLRWFGRQRPPAGGRVREPRFAR
jgi:hypothetical protein